MVIVEDVELERHVRKLKILIICPRSLYICLYAGKVRNVMTESDAGKMMSKRDFEKTMSKKRCRKSDVGKVMSKKQCWKPMSEKRCWESDAGKMRNKFNINVKFNR